MKDEVIIIDCGSRSITIKYSPFDSEFDVDQLTQINHENVYGEIVTCSCLLNRVGILKAEIDHHYSVKKVDFDVFESKLCREIRSSAVSQSEKITEKLLNERVTLEASWQKRKKELIDIEKNCRIVEAWYWAIQDKSKKLNNLSKDLTPDGFVNELIEGSVNSVIIRKRKSLGHDTRVH